VPELRRLLVTPDRLNELCVNSRRLALNNDEQHYLRRVLRLRQGDSFCVTNGQGRLWMAQLHSDGHLSLINGLKQPMEDQPKSAPSIGLAVALVRRGMDDSLRMACELGVDCFQPLRTNRCTVQAEYRPERWQSILREAVEQCERLWMPDLSPLADVKDWIPTGPCDVAIAVARETGIPDLEQWLASKVQRIRPVWLVVGPEGGWTDLEITDAVDRGWQPVDLGPTILRTSTAAVTGAVLLARWRDFDHSIRS
tara:strand:- start:1750 stop:2508 length:759 start_codon:yes stop_codon:yes gene_type:complete